jgi:hypothetical protein
LAGWIEIKPRHNLGRQADFLLTSRALASLMRLSSLKAAHAVKDEATYRKSGFPRMRKWRLVHPYTVLTEWKDKQQVLHRLEGISPHPHSMSGL